MVDMEDHIDQNDEDDLEKLDSDFSALSASIPLAVPVLLTSTESGTGTVSPNTPLLNSNASLASLISDSVSLCGCAGV